MTLTELYDISESENVPVYSFQMNECESISVLQDGNCFVAIDPMKLQSETEEKEKQTTTSASLDRATAETPAPKRKESPFSPIFPVRKY